MTRYLAGPIACAALAFSAAAAAAALRPPSAPAGPPSARAQRSSGPTAILHSPPAAAWRGAALVLSVGLEGVSDGEPIVRLAYRPQGVSEFRSIALAVRGGGRYEGTVPAEATRGFKLSYYISAIGPREAYRVSLGSAAEPLSLDLREPVAPARRSIGAVLTFAGVPLAGIGGTLRLLARNRRRAAAERRFWVRALFPICHLQGQRLEDQIEQLAATPIEHPLDGLRTYSRAQLERRIEALRKLDPATLLRYCSES
jgi:hypothetical protein